MLVYILRYQHRHGTDVSVFRSADSAWRAADEIVKEYRDDFEIPKELSDHDAATDWWQLTDGSEDLLIDEITLQD